MLPQASPTERLTIPKFKEEERLGFDFRAFAEQHGFDGARGGGAHMWREQWDETVSHIYEHTLSKPPVPCAAGDVDDRCVRFQKRRSPGTDGSRGETGRPGKSMRREGGFRGVVYSYSRSSNASTPSVLLLSDYCLGMVGSCQPRMNARSTLWPTAVQIGDGAARPSALGGDGLSEAATRIGPWICLATTKPRLRD